MEWAASQGVDRPLRGLDDGHSDLALCDRTCHLFIRSEKGLSWSAVKAADRPTPGTSPYNDRVQ